MKKLFHNIITNEECLLDESDKILITELENSFDWREWMII